MNRGGNCFSSCFITTWAEQFRVVVHSHETQLESLLMSLERTKEKYEVVVWGKAIEEMEGLC